MSHHLLAKMYFSVQFFASSQKLIIINLTNRLVTGLAVLMLVLAGVGNQRVKESSIKVLVIIVLLVLEIVFDVIFTFFNCPVLLQVAAAMDISSPSCLQLLLWHLTRHVDADQVQNISHMGIIHFKVILIQL